MSDDALRNRLLRRLKARCNALSKYHAPRTAPPVVTYSSQPSASSSSSLELPPLAVLRPPDNWHSSELSKKIYAVRDAFKEIVVRTVAVSEAVPRIPSLASMCASIAGRSLEASYDDDDEDEEKDDDEQVVEQMYEAIPLEYRNSAFVSHSVAIILDNCPHHPTLLRLILDVTLDRHLPDESHLLLQQLLLVAFTPSPSNGTIPIRHPAHSKFLIDLYDVARGGFFVALEAAVQASDAPLAWSCKAVTLLLQRIGKTADTFEFAPMACALLEALRETALEDGDSPLDAMENQLCLWLRSVLALLVNDATDSEVLCISSFLSQEQHITVQTQGLLASLATRLLSHHRHQLSALDETAVVTVLRNTPAQRTVFDPLLRTCLPTGRASMEQYACTIRSEKLLKLEAAFWACALHHIEHVGGELHTWLMDTVDRTEGRYFEMSMADTPARTAVCRDWSEDEWYWEPMIGEWIQKTPGPAPRRKRRKLEVGWDRETPRRSSCRSIMLPPDFAKKPAEEETPLKMARTPLRTTTNFTTLLSRAMAGRTVLHANSPFRNPSDDSPFSVSSSPYTPVPQRVSFKRPRSPSPLTDGFVPSSDDLLAYATPCRR